MDERRPEGETDVSSLHPRSEGEEDDAVMLPLSDYILRRGRESTTICQIVPYHI